jgi:hypothetical protein
MNEGNAENETKVEKIKLLTDHYQATRDYVLHTFQSENHVLRLFQIKNLF